MSRGSQSFEKLRCINYGVLYFRHVEILTLLGATVKYLSYGYFTFFYRRDDRCYRITSTLALQSLSIITLPTLHTRLVSPKVYESVPPSFTDHRVSLFSYDAKF